MILFCILLAFARRRPLTFLQLDHPVRLLVALFGILFGVVAATSQQQHVTSKAAEDFVRQQIAEACYGKPGTFEPGAVVERDITGDGEADLIISHLGIKCPEDGMSSFCGGSACSIFIYVRRGGAFTQAGEILSGGGFTVGEGKLPTIRAIAHGGKVVRLKWNGKTFR
jgi:hypothetical protein